MILTAIPEKINVVLAMSDIFKFNPTVPGKMKERRRNYFSPKQLEKFEYNKTFIWLKFSFRHLLKISPG